MHKPENHIIVIFGASGDLTERKLIPSLYDLYYQNLMPDEFAILGVGRTDISDDSFRTKIAEGIGKFAKKERNSDVILDFSKHLFYISLNTQEPNDYGVLKDKLTVLDKSANANGNYLYYLATPPVLYDVIPQALAMQNLNSCGECAAKRKIVVEKPFGYNLKTAVALNKHLLEYFSEDQIYRIDHYLGKETVQNVLVTRFANGFFEPIWSNHFIEHVEITAAESIGIEGRGGYYDNSGAMRDMVQNHLTQLVGLVAMEPPAMFDATSLRNEIAKVFHSFRIYKPEEVAKHVIRGQYAESMVRGSKMSSYLSEKGVKQDSKTESFVALKLNIDNWRWGGVPFYIRTGKRMPTAVTEIVLHMKKAPHQIFGNNKISQTGNQIIIRIQPDEGIAMKFGMKVPGSGFEVQNVNMDFHYTELSDAYIPSAYERLLLDCMFGDSTLYTRADALDATWQFVDPILNAWQANPDIPLYKYPSGHWGPEESKLLFADTKQDWRYPCKNLGDDKYCEL